MKAPVDYFPLLDGIFDKEMASRHFERLNSDVEWVQRGNTPRREAFYCVYPTDYFYGTAEYGRSYAANTDIPEVLRALWTLTEIHCKTKFEACFLNRYDHAREHLGWHADDSDSIDDGRPIAVVSFGAERELWFRENPGVCYACNGSGRYDHNGSPPCASCNGTGRRTTEVEKLLLENGSLAIMRAGMQDTHQHRIPKAGFECGPRISLTFRGLVNAS